MADRPPTINYEPPPPADGRGGAQIIKVIGFFCLSIALYVGLISHVRSWKDAPYTPEYAAHLASFDARQRLDPVRTFRPIPPFSGKTHVPRPLLSLPTTYIAVGFAGAGVALLVFAERMRVRNLAGSVRTVPRR